MATFTASVLIFDHGAHCEEEEERAREAVQAYLDTLPDYAESWRGAWLAELEGEDHDPVAADLWQKVEEFSHATAVTYGLRRWATKDPRAVRVEIE